MDHATVTAYRERHAAWRLLRAGNAPLVLVFLGDFFVDGNRGPTRASEVVDALEDTLYDLNDAPQADGDADEKRYPKQPRAYLEDWATTENGWLRRFYPTREDEIHYEVTPAFEKAHAWVEGLAERSFVGTESRLHTVVELLRQIVHGTETDPETRLARLREQREALDAEIAAAEAGDVPVLDDTGVRDRYQQVASTARDLLTDFREVEENFRRLDRSAREKIAAWEGGKGELLAELVGSRSDISTSDQGRTFQSFYDLLLSETRQDELRDLLKRVQQLDSVDTDRRLGTVHRDWSDAAERAQRTVRQISDQLRRFLDEQVWVENRRVLDLVREVEQRALTLRAEPPEVGLDVDEIGLTISLPFERPLYDARPTTEVDSLPPPETETDLDSDALFTQTFVDTARLSENIRALVPSRSSALLEDIVAMYPMEHGAAELVGYLALGDDELEVELDEDGESLIDLDADGTRRARLPQATVRRK